MERCARCFVSLECRGGSSTAGKLLCSWPLGLGKVPYNCRVLCLTTSDWGFDTNHASRGLCHLGKAGAENGNRACTLKPPRTQRADMHQLQPLRNGADVNSRSSMNCPAERTPFQHVLCNKCDARKTRIGSRASRLHTMWPQAMSETADHLFSHQKRSDVPLSTRRFVRGTHAMRLLLYSTPSGSSSCRYALGPQTRYASIFPGEARLYPTVD